MSPDAEAPGAAGPELPREWDRLEARAAEISMAIVSWRRRALESEAELERLRRVFEEVALASDAPPDPRAELRRLRAENAALRSRMQQARGRVRALLKRLSAIEEADR